MIWIVIGYVISTALAHSTPLYLDNDLNSVMSGTCQSESGGQICCQGQPRDCYVKSPYGKCSCDESCEEYSNCCVDYYVTCIGLPDLPLPFETPTSSEKFQADFATMPVGCQYNDQFYKAGEFSYNCQRCHCILSQWGFRVECDPEECLVNKRYKERIHGLGAAWRTAMPKQFRNLTVQDGLRLKTGTKLSNAKTWNMLPVHIYGNSQQLPKRFDTRLVWPDSLSEIMDQGLCGSSWAIATTAVASDRAAILSGGKPNIKLSPQDILSCHEKRTLQMDCDGGYVDVAWNHIRKFGIVTTDCLPYTAGISMSIDPCFQQFYLNLCDGNTRGKLFLKTSPAYRVPNDVIGIMLEIFKYGPVQAIMKVYKDLFYYRKGVYEHIDKEDTNFSYHSVRIVGWGEKIKKGDKTPYWIVANSWGKSWGEKGYFKIRRGSNECDIENFVIASWGYY